MKKKCINQAVILAGGLGTRLRPFTDTMPKPMYPVNGVPFIDYLLRQIKSFGIEKVVILLGYLPDKVTNHVGDGKKYGLDISYDISPIDYDSGARLIHGKDLLDDEFLLMYCDNYCPINFDKLQDDFIKNNPMIQMSVYANKDNYTKSNLIVDDSGLVTLYDKSRKSKNLLGTEIGYSIVKRDVLDMFPGNDLNFSALFPELISNKQLYATVTEHRYYSIGSFDRMHLTEEFFRDKRVAFLDRDGTLNVRAPKACYIERPEDFIWLDGAKEAVKLLDQSGYITILISNQPGIARGNLTVDTLNKIHDKMQNDLADIGTKIDYIYYCPHNWDDGCECRKPNPGMLFQAQKDLSLNLPKCILFGDDERDIEAATRANCPSVLVSNDYPLIEAVKDYIKVKKLTK